MSGRATAIAFFLPQYHPVPENDAWWGPGFTEWRNVVRARPRFRGHEQPRLPGELGFYDLRLPEVRVAQAELARAHGIGAFCYYHYWFHGRRVLERPVNDLLARGEPDFPFCLCWANENWTRVWDGGNQQVLLEQTYSAADDERHIEALLPVFADRRYLRHEGRPVFLVYRASQLPDARRTTDRWRERARAAGLPGLHLLRAESFFESGDPRPLGFDESVDFQPRATPPILGEPLWKRMRRKLATTLGWPAQWKNHVHGYDEIVARALARPPTEYVRHPCVAPSWDNSPRRRAGAFILRGSSPERYEAWLRAEVARCDGGYVFINAWNEWAEGCHLEPCLRHGRAYLEATRRALGVAAGEACAEETAVMERSGR